jgi:hypothetical protein
MKKLNFSLYFFILLVTVSLRAQTTKEEFSGNANYAGGVYCPYLYENTVHAPVPEGYVPFYISHYGRHGSRWVLSPAGHVGPMNILGDAEKAGALSTLGKSLYARMKIIAEDAANHYGDLSPLGVQEHRGIAERMFQKYPEVFSTKNGHACVIRSRSTQVPRCILSMAANNERLKELNPGIQITRQATRRDSYMNTEGETNKDTVKVIVTKFLRKHVNPSRFIGSIFSDTAYAREHIDDQVEFVNTIFAAAINMPNLDYLHISLMDLFTNEESFILWQGTNLQMYFGAGPSPVNGKSVLNSILPLLKDIVECADSAIAYGNVSADLRFGHDVYIIPLLAIMDIKGMNACESNPDSVFAKWCAFKASPMGANLQLIFYKNETSGDILVKFLQCEKETELPVKTDAAPYYHWNDVRAYFQKKIAGYVPPGDNKKEK